jgi:hypothetical protein
MLVQVISKKVVFSLQLGGVPLYSHWLHHADNVINLPLVYNGASETS